MNEANTNIRKISFKGHASSGIAKIILARPAEFGKMPNRSASELAMSEPYDLVPLLRRDWFNV